ncbi:hypothetical protein BD626DRAFT_410400 [Schizophyllum amplum]|uniref:NAD(P)-binding protein n=1 Tax=Schizophyllum amplum TaxID=97359 RepID=A0A550C0Y4_9AGAR|nr:hypothetical protein BD626DRAFT_410400 [Auriculariopsis ampla]
MADRPRDAIVIGATQCLGKAIALRLARYGLSIGLNDIPSKKGALDGVARASRITADSCKKTSNIGAVGRVGAAHMAATTLHSTFLGPAYRSAIGCNKVTSVSATGVFLCYQLAARKMIKLGHRGRLISASSIGGKQPLHGFTSYTAAKFAVRGLTQSAGTAYLKPLSLNTHVNLSACLGMHGITVDVYTPGTSTYHISPSKVYTHAFTHSQGWSTHRLVCSIAPYLRLGSGADEHWTFYTDKLPILLSTSYVLAFTEILS